MRVLSANLFVFYPRKVKMRMFYFCLEPCPTVACVSKPSPLGRPSGTVSGGEGEGLGEGEGGR